MPSLLIKKTPSHPKGVALGNNHLKKLEKEQLSKPKENGTKDKSRD